MHEDMEARCDRVLISVRGSDASKEAMSRTDKDTPWWVRAVWYEPDHDRTCVLFISANYQHRWGPERNPCDLPSEPVVGDGLGLTRRTSKGCHRKTRCTWSPEYPHRDRFKYTRRPDRSFFLADWWGPARTEERDILHDAKKRYHSEGDPGDREPRGHHRHSPFNGGWWD